MQCAEYTGWHTEAHVIIFMSTSKILNGSKKNVHVSRLAAQKRLWSVSLAFPYVWAQGEAQREGAGRRAGQIHWQVGLAKAFPPCPQMSLGDMPL